MSKTIRRQRSVMADEDREEEEKNDELEQQMQKKLAAQRVAAIGKRPRGLAADTPVDDNSEDEEEEDEFRDEYTYSVQDDPGLYKDVHDYSQLQAASKKQRAASRAPRTIAEPEAADEEMPGSAKPPDARQQALYIKIPYSGLRCIAVLRGLYAKLSGSAKLR
ncbi:hypothetical protein T492DRAFT_1116410 [Pavlovales sp. CCMP2436]|nr:hypothetical protein T492DRAFT_1116410 [Pavlovales sp. CCMP2436]